MNRTVAAISTGLFFFVSTALTGCAADADDGVPSSQESSSTSAAPNVVKAAELPNSFAHSAGPACLPGKYTSGWTTLELLPDGRGLRAEVLHDGTNALFAESGITWSSTDRTITLGLVEQPMRVEADCRFVWMGESMFTRQPR